MKFVSGSAVEIHFEYKDLDREVTEGQTITWTFNFSVVESSKIINDQTLSVCAWIENPEIVSVNSSIQGFDLNTSQSNSFSVNLHGVFVGRSYAHLVYTFSKTLTVDSTETQHSRTCWKGAGMKSMYEDKIMKLVLNYAENGVETFTSQHEIVTVREERPIDTAFTAVVIMLVFVINIGLGCKIDLNIIKETLCRPIAPAIGFCSQFLIMPLVSYNHQTLTYIQRKE